MNFRTSLMNRMRMKLVLAILAVAAFLLGTAGGSLAQANLNTLASFDGTNGEYTQSGLTLSHDGKTLYGTTSEGGAYGGGTVFSIPVGGGAVTTLASFSEQDPNGEHPYGDLILSADGKTLYGTTQNGGTSNGGILFSVPASGGAITTLANFINGGDNASVPIGGLTLSSDGNTFYGITSSGGAYDDGTVFFVPVSGGAVTTLASFDSQYFGASDPNGSLILSSDGKTLYGTTQSGGISDDGTVFSIPAGGGVITTLASFSLTNGNSPKGSLTLSSDGKTFYGITASGGTDDGGTVFSVPVAGGAITTLANFSNANYGGVYPQGSLTLSPDGSILYGTTSDGGTNNYGTVFSIPVDGGTITTIASFSSFVYSVGGLTLSSDGKTAYGTTYEGGTYDVGTVFSLAVGPTWSSVDVTVGSDSKTRLLWNNTDGTAGVWSVDDKGVTSNLTSFGPFTGWAASAIAAGADGYTRMLWNKTDGTAGVWILNANNTYNTGFNFGPYTGWTAVDVTVGSDNKARLLWTKSDGTAGVWTVDNSGNLSNLTNYGPYPGWTASRIAAGSDGYTRLLWNKTDGTAGLWILNANNSYKAGFDFGPYTGSTAVDISVGTDNKTRLLWTDVEGGVAVWTVDNSGNYTHATSFGPYTDWTATKIAVGGDGLSRLLWNETDGTVGLWLLNSTNTFSNGFDYGPY